MTSPVKFNGTSNKLILQSDMVVDKHLKKLKHAITYYHYLTLHLHNGQCHFSKVNKTNILSSGYIQSTSYKLEQ